MGSERTSERYPSAPFYESAPAVPAFFSNYIVLKYVKIPTRKSA